MDGRPTKMAALLGVVLVVALSLVVGSAGQARAHSDLVSSEPAAGAVLETAPSRIVLTFVEQVDPTTSTVSLFDPQARPVAVGPVAAAPGSDARLVVDLTVPLGEGTHTVTWSVSSADAHPVGGRFQFSVGRVSETVPVDVVTPGAESDRGVSVLLWVARLTGFAGLVLGPGALLSLVLLRAGRDLVARMAAPALTGLVLVVVSSVGLMLLQVFWASSAGLGDLIDSQGELSTRSTWFDRVLAGRLYLAVALTIVVGAATAVLRGGLHETAGHRTARMGTSRVTVLQGPRPTSRAAAGRSSGRRAATTAAPVGMSRPAMLTIAAGVATGSVALVVTWPLTGHASVGPAPALAVTVNALHLGALVIWLGGLVVVATVLRHRTADSGAERADRGTGHEQLVDRFSRLALACMALAVVTGAVLAVREVGSVGALTSTAYGRVLLAKLVCVAAILASAAAARSLVRRQFERAAGQTAGMAETVETAVDGALRRRVWTELALAAVVLGLTSQLVALSPPRSQSTSPATSSTSSTSDTSAALAGPVATK